MAYKEVYFYKYCYKCSHFKEEPDDTESACYDCLSEPVNNDSHRPVKFEESITYMDLR